MPRNGDATRAAILDAAMTMFVERGYDKTSLREIAEACGVTKAALYYHFRTKVEIVRAALDSYASAMTAIVQWLERTSPGRERDSEFVDRVLDAFSGSGATALRFSQANPTVLAREEFGERNVDYIRTLVATVAGPDPDADATLRATMAVGSLVLGSISETPLGTVSDPKAQRTAARALALEILSPLSSRHSS